MVAPKGDPPEVAGQHGGFDPLLFPELLRAEERHFWFRARNRIILEVASQITSSLSEGYRVLEVGCGNGNVLRALEKCCGSDRVVGMDAHVEGLRYARGRTACALVAGDARRLPFKAEFDVVGAFDVIEHVEDDLRVLRAFGSVLRPGGTLLITVPACQTLWSYFDVAACHCRRYEAADLRRKLVAAGYRVNYLTHFMAAIFPLVWFLRRVSSRRDRSQGDSVNTKRSRERAVREFRVVPLLNAFLEAVVAQERHLIRRRVTIPFGTSLLACATRGGPD